MIALLTTVGSLAVAQTLPEPHMAFANWLFLGLAWLFVCTLLVWSFVRVLSGPPGGSKSDAS